MSFEFDFAKRLSLIAAGNANLFHASFLFDPELGNRFATHALPWICKGVWRQARFDRSNGTRPDNIKCTRDVQLDHVRKGDDREIEIAIGRIPQRRTLCITPSDDGDSPQDSNFAGMISDGYATLINPSEATAEAAHAAFDENETLSGRLDNLHAMLEAKSDQILNERERSIYRARYLFPARKTKLKELTDRYGLSEARISQIATEANKKVLAAINPAECHQGGIRFPTYKTIDDWCDELPRREGETACAHHKRRQKVRREQITEWLDASDYNIQRVRRALSAGITPEDVGTVLDIPTTTTEDPKHNPAANLVKLVEYRRAAVEQDRETKERLERYRALKQAEMLERCTRATLTLKGYEKAIELEQRTTEAESRPTVAEGSDQTPSARKVSAA